MKGQKLERRSCVAFCLSIAANLVAWLMTVFRKMVTCGLSSLRASTTSAEISISESESEEVRSDLSRRRSAECPVGFLGRLRREFLRFEDLKRLTLQWYGWS